MPHIAIISSSVRTGRNSHRVALYFQRYLEQAPLATVEILDLAQYRFPLFDERLKFQKSPPEQLLDFAKKIRSADGVIMITPEYNGGYPASLKNIVDLLYDEWKRKPIAISTVSEGSFGGAQVLTSLQFTLWKIGAWTVPASFPVPKVLEMFHQDGTAIDKPREDKRAEKFIRELWWCIEANSRMSETKR